MTDLQLVLEILEGKWSSGNKRKEALIKAGYDYDKVQALVTKKMEKMRTRKEAMKPWFDACKEQEQWSYNAKYNWGKWKKTVESSKNYGTCITYPNAVAMRCKLIKEQGKIITSTGSSHDSKSTQDSFYSNSVKAMASINSKYWSSIKYPEKTTAELVKEGKIKEGDIIGFMGHTSMYADKNSKGSLTYNNAGHAAGIYDNDKPGSNRAVLNVTSPGMSKRKVYGVFSVNTFFVITDCIGGTITPSDRYMAGQTATITITPDKDKEIKSIKVDGKNIPTNSSYTIKKIDSSHIIEVVCDKKSEKKYTGKLPTYHLKKTNQQVIQDTIKWAKLIANDNRFHYGYTSPDRKINAHHNGCYFCGTNTTKGGRSKKGIVDYKLTYCCNPFVGAAWAHGGCVPKALELCQKGSSWDFKAGGGYDASKLFDNLGHPAKSKLKAGDVLCRDTHVALYIGNGKIAEAGAGDNNVRNSKIWNMSIRVKDLTDKNYNNFKRVHRFNGNVDKDLYIRFGEISDRVKDLQSYLNYFGNYNLAVDGIYFEKTLAAVKDFQLKKFGKGEDDGIVGPKTIAAMTD